MKKTMMAIALAGALALPLSAISADYTPVEPMATLRVDFADTAWDGKTIPKGQECSWAGGKGSSPVLTVSNIPAAANAIIVEFSDRTFKPNDLGGHGKIGIWLSKNQASATIPAVAGESFDLPEGMFIEEAHRSQRGKPGAYLPPCSGGRGNEYYATVKAVYKPKSDKEEARLLGQAAIEMGKY
jgi:hypothetical protein